MIAERMCRILVLCLLPVLPVLPAPHAGAFPLSGDQTVLPPGTELNEDSLDRPREVFKSQALGGVKSYLVNLGDLAFNSPYHPGRSCAARRDQLRHLPCQRRRERQALRSGNVEPAGELRHHRPAVQSEGAQFCPRSRQNSEPARRALPRALRGRRPNGVAARFRAQRDRRRVRRAGAVAGHARCAGGVHRGHRLPAQSETRHRGPPDAVRQPCRTARRSAVLQTLSARSAAELRRLPHPDCGLCRPQAAHRGLRRALQDPHPAQREFQCALLPRRAIRHLRPGGRAFRSHVRTRAFARRPFRYRRLSHGGGRRPAAFRARRRHPCAQGNQRFRERARRSPFRIAIPTLLRLRCRPSAASFGS